VALAAASATAIAQGVWLRPFRNLIYAMPPYVCGEEDLRRVARAMVAAARAV
jgi:adenosylmethionine-8-amino-7-oxononanoate aminotransferase